MIWKIRSILQNIFFLVCINLVHNLVAHETVLKTQNCKEQKLLKSVISLYASGTK